MMFDLTEPDNAAMPHLCMFVLRSLAKRNARALDSGIHVPDVWTVDVELPSVWTHAKPVEPEARQRCYQLCTTAQYNSYLYW